MLYLLKEPLKPCLRYPEQDGQPLGNYEFKREGYPVAKAINGDGRDGNSRKIAIRVRLDKEEEEGTE